ncbi:MAG: hypothetical protein IH898_06480, partial [Planctomycetes bacterium]|nr:hypothetical protein [Planctomycetota bacterium]
MHVEHHRQRLIGPTVAVVGRVKRPAIYELVEGAPLPSLGRVLEFAGGTLRPSGNRFLHIAADETGRETVHERSDLESVAAGDGDLLIVELSQNIQLGYVTLEGHVRVPGRRSIQFASSVHQLVPDKGILDQNPYLPFAVLERTDELTQARRFYPISLQAVLAGQIDVPLRPDDILIVLSRDD